MLKAWNKMHDPATDVGIAPGNYCQDVIFNHSLFEATTNPVTNSLTNYRGPELRAYKVADIKNGIIWKEMLDSQ